MAFLWLRGLLVRGRLKDTALSGVKGCLPFFKLFRQGMGAGSAPEPCPSLAWAVQVAWAGVRSQAFCPLLVIGSRPARSGEGPVARTRRSCCSARNSVPLPGPGGPAVTGDPGNPERPRFPWVCQVLHCSAELLDVGAGRACTVSPSRSPWLTPYVLVLMAVPALSSSVTSWVRRVIERGEACLFLAFSF